MTQVFLSHSTSDANFAARLAADLRAAGIPVWKAPESILPGEAWVPAIQRGLSTSTHLVLLMSPDAVKSRWVNVEFDTAFELNVQEQMTIIPIDYETCSAPPFWKRFQAIAKFIGDYDANLSTLKARLQTDRPSDPPAPTDPATTLHVGIHGVVTYADQPKTPPQRIEVIAPSAPHHSQAVRDEIGGPFEWVDIPVGQVTLEEGGYVPKGGQTYSVERFAIGKYAITNAQFEVFVADGYADPRWWMYSTDAKKWHSQHLQSEAPAFGVEADHPRVNVSWYDAVAFCLWLSGKTSQRIMLPDERQWQRAAQGDDGRAYAWGKEEPDDTLANWGNKVGQTTAVDSYPEQARRSAFGLFNMTGNVWEWCVTDYETGGIDTSQSAQRRALRGGSWDNTNTNSLRAAARDGDTPGNRSLNYGFRCARSY